MKYCKNLFVLLIANICFCQFIFCQNNNPPNQRGDVRRDSVAKKSFLDEILAGIASGLSDNNKRLIPTEKYARIKYEFKRQKIYPSGDALELLYVLNPWLENMDEIPPTTTFKMPDFPWLDRDVKRKMKTDYQLGSQIDQVANAKFDSLSGVFNSEVGDFVQRFNDFVKTNNVDATEADEFLDTLSGFTRNFLPSLKNKSGSICKSKMDYINFNLSELADDISNSTEITDESIFLVQNIVRDFLATNDIDIRRSSGFKNYIQSPFIQNVSYAPANFESAQEDGSEADFSENKPLKCRVYIYTPGGEVIRGKFHVWFAPYVTVYNMDKCQDVKECLHDKGAIDANEASTAGASIPNNSNWAIYCIDRNNQAFLVNEEFNYQNIVNRDEAEESSFKILLIYHGNPD